MKKIYPQDELFMLEAVEQLEMATVFGPPRQDYKPIIDALVANGDLEPVTHYRRTEKGKARQQKLEGIVRKLAAAVKGR
jgi:hypothetical protein